MNNEKIVIKIYNFIKQKYIIKIIIILIIILVAIIILKIIKFNRSLLINNIKLGNSFEKVNVILSGAINNPGNYYFNLNTKLEEAIDLAGGITTNADISNLNLNKILLNKEKIEIPIKQKEKEEIIESNYKININTADKNDLKTLPGIGDATAKKIIEYRENNTFEDIEEIKEVPGIGDVKYNLIKELITI